MLAGFSEWISQTWATEIAVLTLFTAAAAIRCGLGFYYGRKSTQAVDIGNTKDKLLKQIALKYEGTYRLNGGVANTAAMIEKFLYRDRRLGLSLMTWQHITTICKLSITALCALRCILQYEAGEQWEGMILTAAFGTYVLLMLELLERLVDVDGRREQMICMAEDYLDNVLAEKLVISEISSRRDAMEQARAQQKREQYDNIFAQNTGKTGAGKTGRKISMQEADVITDVLEEYL